MDALPPRPLPVSENPEWLRPLDHTADAGFVVEGDDLPELFGRAAWGMFDLLCDLRAVEPREQEVVETEADDLPGLLVRWLSELNYRHITGRKLFSRFEVAFPGPHQLRAEVWGEEIDLSRHTVFTEIKAVTYHGLSVERRGDRWEAGVIFDL